MPAQRIQLERPYARRVAMCPPAETQQVHGLRGSTGEAKPLSRRGMQSRQKQHPPSEAIGQAAGRWRAAGCGSSRRCPPQRTHRPQTQSAPAPGTCAHQASLGDKHLHPRRGWSRACLHGPISAKPHNRRQLLRSTVARNLVEMAAWALTPSAAVYSSYSNRSVRRVSKQARRAPAK